MTDLINHFMSQLGYVGIALLMLAETVFPPIPSEVIMPLAGMQTNQGPLSLTGVIVAGSTGAMVGNIFWYGVARMIGVDRLHLLVDQWGRWLTLDWSEVERGRRLFARGGGAFVCLGRMIPTIRSIVSVPAGLLAMPFGRFAAWSLLGTAAWTTLLTGAGAALGARYGALETIIGPISTLVIVGIVAWYIWRVARWKQ